MVVKLWGFYYRRVNGMKLNKLDLCLFPTAVYKFIDTISDYCTSSIKDQIIDISYTSGKEQLNHLNDKRQSCTGKKHFPKTIQVFIQNWQNNTCWDKHAYISDDINSSFALYIIIKNINKRNQIEPNRLNTAQIDDKRKYMTVDCEKRVKDKTNKNNKIYVHEKKYSFSFPYNLLLAYPYCSPA